MKLTEKIEKDFRNALKSKDETKVSVLRLLKSSIKNKEIEKKSELTDDDIFELVLKEIKKRKEAEELYAKGRRPELVEKEKKEIKFLENYMPKKLLSEELEKIIKEEIASIGASGPGDIGKVMGQVMPKVKGRADGSEVSQKVAELLNK